MSGIFSEEITTLSAQLISELRACKQTLSIAESCTGGLIGAAITSISGASEVFTHGFITYANAAKVSVLDVPEALIAAHGAVSEEVARAMAEGALRVAEADIAISVTGIAGPGGGSEQKPVGLVYIACAQSNQPTRHKRFIFNGNRDKVRLAATAEALKLALENR